MFSFSFLAMFADKERIDLKFDICKCILKVGRKEHPLSHLKNLCASIEW